MKLALASPVLLLFLLQPLVAAEPSKTLDVRRAVPNDVFLVVYAKHNPERDYQRAYYEDVWKTVQETRIFERALAIVTTRMSEQDLQQAKSVINELQEAVKPIDVEAVANAKEFIYAQQMKIPTSQHLALARMTPEAATSTAQGVKNLFGIAKKYLQDAVTIETSKIGAASVTTMSIGPQVPFSPTIATLGDIVLFSSSSDLARESLQLLTEGNGKSKFDDPRLADALGHLPTSEDSLVFYDGQQQMRDLAQFGPFIQTMSGGDPDAMRVVNLIKMIIDELSIFDYEVTVAYTEGNLNRSASYGHIMPNSDDKLIMKMVGRGKPFEKWQAWVPAGALSYSLCTGLNLHPLHERVMSVLEKDFPETKPGLEKFEQIQTQLDVHLDHDILQAFTGEYVSVTLPKPDDSPLGGPGSFMALRCAKPDRIRELLHRAMDALQKQPALKMQQIQLTESKDLDGFEELSVLTLAAFGVRPVIGFHDGWMMIGSNSQAIKQVLDAQAGKIETVEKTDDFKRLKMDVQGPVTSIKYANMAENTRNTAKAINQIGTMVPMIMAMANANADDPNLKPVQELLALLPDVAKIVAKFDFLEASLTVTQAGDQPDTYTKRSVVVVRTPEAEVEKETK